MKKLLAILLSAVLLVGALPLTVFAEMGGDFAWTDSSDQMLIEQILERDGLIDGIWFPWFNGGQTGHNLTGNELMAEYYNSSSSKDWNRVELDYYGADNIYREIYNLKAMGYNIMAYGGSIMGEGVIFDDNGDVIGIKEEYLTNARRLLDMCREIGMPVMWNIYFHCSSMPSYYGMEGWHVIAQMLGNREVADHYAENFVRPLCEMLAEYPDVVALVSIADEPENEINDDGIGNHYTNGREMYGVNQDDMIYFMQQINEVAREELPGVARTVASNSGNKTIYRDFDLDLMGHNQYTDGSSFKSVESLITDADPILTEYNIGSTVSYTDDQYAQKLITFREWMMDNGYKGGFQWCWMTNASGTGSSYYLQRSASDSTSFRKTVSLLKYYIDEYRAEYRGETIGLDAPVLYANAGDGKVLWIPSQNATTITIQRSDDGGSTWTNLVTNVAQSDYVDAYLVGRYTDSTTRPTSGYCYRIIASDGTNTVTSEPNNLAGADTAYKKTYTAPTYTKGKYYITSSLTQSDAKLTAFGVEKNRPLSGSNLITNGGFETTSGQWNNASFLQYAQVVSDSTAPEGSNSLYFDTSANSTVGWYTFTVTGLTANTEYTFSTWIKGAYLADDNKGMASVGVIDPDTGKFMFYWEYFRSYPRASRETMQIYPTAWDDEWHLRSVSFNTGDTTTATIALYGYSSQMWLDDMALYESANGKKYENGESAAALTSSTWEDLSATATNAVEDPTVSNSAYWSAGAGYKQGFMSIASGALKYTASSDPSGVRYTKWIDVKPGTDYYVSFDVKVTTAGSGRVVVLDNSKSLPNEVASVSLSSTGTKTYQGRISSGKYDQLGLCVVDLGGVATIDNICFYEVGESVEIPTDPSYDGYITNGDFEVGTSNGWENLWGSNTVEMVSGRDSLFAMKVTAGNYTHVRQLVNVEANTDYVIEVWSKDVVSTSLLVKDGADTTNIKQVSLPSGSSWTQTTLEFNSGSYTQVLVSLMGVSTSAAYTVDDVYMYKKETVSGLVNGDFEDGEEGWAFNSGTHAIVTDAHGGSYALQLTNPGTWAEGAIQTIAVDPNTSYTITWWYKATSGTGVFNLFVMDGVSYANMTAEGGEAYMNSYTGAWQQGSYVVNTGSYTTMMLKFSTEGSSPGTILIDDVVVAKTDSICSHSYSNNCDAICDLCGETRSVAGHSYSGSVTAQPTCGTTGTRTYTCSVCGDSYTETIPATGSHVYTNDCDASCDSCGTTRTVTHTYSGTCDTTCNVCGGIRLLFNTAHTYDNACDGECNVCGFTRTVSGHVYDNDCDADCNTCGTVREAGHVYDDDCDTDCNTCGTVREAGHTYDNDCDADCNVCGDIRDTADHKYVESTMANATCGAEGMSKFTCSVCGDYYTQVIPATGNHIYSNDCDTRCNVCYKVRQVGDHKYVGVQTKDPTCTETGVMTYTCSSCGTNYTESIPVLSHDYKAVVTAPDCVNGGYTTYTCSVCGDEYVADQTAALGHTYDNACDTACNVCGDSRTITHDYKAVVTAPDCVNGGYTTYTCSVCGDKYVADQTVALGHTYDNACDTACNVCGDIRTITHDYKAVVTAPDCVNGGYTTYTCSVCGDKYVADQTVALGHTYDNACDTACNVCGDIRTITHDYKAVVTAPDCVNGGYTTYTCSVCGDNYVADQTVALGHTYDNACDTACNICGDTRTITHDYKAVVTAPDCVNGGYTTYTCSVCGDKYVADQTAALGHTYDGELDVDCNVCGDIREVELPIVFGGNSVSEDVSGLAFRFDVEVDGMTANGTTAVYDNATVNGYKLISMGAIVSNGVSELDVKAVYLCDLTDTAASFAVRIINIPATKYDVAITAIPYFVVEIDGVQTTLYGEAQANSYNGVLG